MGYKLLLMLLPCALASGLVAHAEETREELLLFWEEKDLRVETPTRSVKPISQVAENITVVTAKDIEDMHAHTVSEVLNRVTGVIVNFQGQDFGSSALLSIQGSEDRHVTVLLDGIEWNFVGSANAETNQIPVDIIDRIEIVKGPASSSWGSALGGVINIITKAPTGNAVPGGMLKGSYGEANSFDLGAQVSGAGGPLRYYLFGGRQYSTGLVSERDYSSNSFYSKFDLKVAEPLDLGFSLGFGNPVNNAGAEVVSQTASTVKQRILFGSTNLTYRFSEKLSLTLNGSSKWDRVTVTTTLGNDLFKDLDLEERNQALNLKLTYATGAHRVVLGAMMSRGIVTQTIANGPLLQLLGQPAAFQYFPSINRRAIYANDTVSVGSFAITPGLRLDDNDYSGRFVSPSLGATYRIGERAIARLDAARGFTIPPLTASSGQGTFFVSNPNLKSENVWSVQGGLEFGVTDYLWLKPMVFYHDTMDSLKSVALGQGTGSSSTFTYVNGGHIRRAGYELQLESASIYNLSTNGGFAYVHVDPQSTQTPTTRSYHLGVKYDDQSFMAQFSGNRVWWDIKSDPLASSDSIWDLNVEKRILITEKTTGGVFLALHNMFNGNYFQNTYFRNPGRWVEGGLRLRF